jgi:hypothetical protein
MADYGFGQENEFITLITTGQSLASAVPEPSTLILVMLGMATLVVRRKRR